MLTENQYNKLEANTNIAGIEDSVWDVYLIDEQSKEIQNFRIFKGNSKKIFKLCCLRWSVT